jgi:hypothetical protein
MDGPAWLLRLSLVQRSFAPTRLSDDALTNVSILTPCSPRRTCRPSARPGVIGEDVFSWPDFVFRNAIGIKLSNSLGDLH